MRPRHSRRRFLLAAGAVGSLSLAGCTDDDPAATPTGPVDSEYDLSVDHDIERWERYDPDWEPPGDAPTDADFDVEVLAEGLELPWDLSFVSGDDLFVSERVGRISRYDGGTVETVVEPTDVIDHATAMEPDGDGGWWAGGSEGGLLGVALHPNYPDVPVLYVFYTYRAGDEEFRNRVVYVDVTDPGEETVVVDEIPGHELIHNGGRIAFGPRNYLWVTTGDANEESLSQNPDRLSGSILRLNPDGTAPADNPEVGDPRVFTYGHRHPQSVSWLPDGTAVGAEHGPQSRDEVFVADAGTNHGWPEARGGDGYDGGGFSRPLLNTADGDTWAPSGGVFYTGADVPALSNRLLLGGLRSQRLNAVSLYPDSAPDIGGTCYDADWLSTEYDTVAHALFEDELGRIRHVEEGPDGGLYAITSNRDGRSTEPEGDSFPREGDDRLVRIVQV